MPADKDAHHPGTTGPVKKEILRGFGQIGTVVANGKHTVYQHFLPQDEFSPQKKKPQVSK